jgi:FkbM family methyltransferase
VAGVVLPRRASRGNGLHRIEPASPYLFSLCSAIAKNGFLRIVVVGANDGRINDPVYSFVKRFTHSTDLILIEPQKSLLPHLRDNYAFHPRTTVCNVAIGEEGSLTLYSVRSSAWPHLNVGYAKDWPPYRAPTGVTSGNRRHVRRWLAKYAPKGADIDSMIAEEIVESRPLPDVLRSCEVQGDIDALQVDTEGMDDIVIFNSGIDELRPRLIHFEAENLSADRLQSIMGYLEQRGYLLGRCGRDMMAVLASDPGDVRPNGGGA